ncbi:hypothetical protein [Halobacteriovorax sp. HLS]|uniref:hypothetical protein n=1 Tax=Halobacteriovorax sp. HLS TaxID=2234000 RepID=UPI000FDC27D2|nr:hypothetical protein [Halobacteriovorax sp. HLS]
MKGLLIALTLLVSSAVSAGTINYDVFKTQKTVESSSNLNSMRIFDFKLAKVVSSKTTTSRRCDTRRARDRQFNCDVVTTTSINVAQVVLSYRPTGTVGRDGEVTNGKKVEFITFNTSLNDLSDEEIEILNSKRTIFSSKEKFVRLATELFEVSTARTASKKHLVSISRK